jgi:hypothetical protein
MEQGRGDYRLATRCPFVPVDPDRDEAACHICLR